MKKLFFYLSLFFLSTNAMSQTDLLTWETTGLLGSEASFPSTSNAGGLLSSSITRGAGLTAAANANRINATAWTITAVAADAVTNNDYFEFTITPTAGNQFSVTQLVFNYERSATGPPNFFVRSSIDGYTADIGSITALPASITSGNTITITGVTGRTSAVTFRIYGYAATGAAGSGGFENLPAVTGPDFVVKGSVGAGNSVSVAAGLTAAEPATNGTFNISLTNPAPAAGVTITYTLTGSATGGGTDYTDPLAGSITITSGNTSGTITLNVADDPTFEGTETINITLNTASAGYSLGTTTASINLLDNDSPPTVSVAAGINAAEPGTNGTFTLTLSAAAPAGGITVNYTLTGTASIGFDYTDPQSGSVTIPAGNTSATVTMNVINDPDVEVPETIILTINTVTSPYTIGTASATISVFSEDYAPIPLVLGTPYTQDFNTLAISGTTNPLAIPGWLMNETGGGARDNELYAADNGGSNTGDTYSYGVTGSGERALGSLQSGSLISTIGSGYINNTGVTITKVRVMYTGEQWRLGATGRNDRLDFQISSDATSITTGTWTDVNALDFVAPNSGPAAGALVGNNAGNRVTYSFDITGLSIAPGATFFIRWNSFDASGADDGVAIDDFSIEANPPDLTAPSVLSVTPANGATGISINTNANIVFDEPVQKIAGGLILLRKTSDNSLVQLISVNSPAVTVSDGSVSFFLKNLLANTGYYIEIGPSTFEDLSGNDFAGFSGSGTWSFTTGTDFYVANFQGCSSSLTEGFSQYSEVGPIIWACTSFGRDPAAPAGSAPFPFGVQINGFSGGTNVPNEDWLISPSFDLTGTTYPLLAFWSRTAFNGAPLQLKVSTDYISGDPMLATWTDLNGKFPGQTSNIWALSENINLAAYKQTNVHFAFVYTSSDDDGARWTLDDISLVNSPVPPPPSLTVSTTDIQFPYTASGSSSFKSFKFIVNDMTDDITLLATGPFLISKNGLSYHQVIVYTAAEANNINETVFVQFSPAQNNLDFTGNILLTTAGGLNANVNLKGTSIDPATTLEVVNWNLEWFGHNTLGPTNNNQQEANVRTILQSIGADIYGVVEVVDEARLANVVSQMPGYSYVIGNFGSHVNPPEPGGGPLSEAQKLAFIYKTSLFSNITTRPLINLPVGSASYNNWSGGRYPFLMSADITQNCMTKHVNFVLIHAKANTSPTNVSYDRREASANELRDTINTYFGTDNVVILGDFNDDLDFSITAGKIITSYHSFMDDPVNFTSPTLALSLAGKKSTVSFNDMIDHVMLSNEMVPYYMAGSANVLNDVASLVSNYGSTTTDHYPVFTRYRFANTEAPKVTSCTEEVTSCVTVSGNYTIPAFVATDDCDATLTYTYTITGATSRSGNSNDASGAFNVGNSLITWTATDSWGNSVGCQTNVTINSNPSVTIPDAFALPSGVLANTVYIGYAPASSITLNANVSGGSPGYSYSWTSGSTVSSATVSPVVNTIYTVTITDALGCQAMASKSITVMDIRSGNNMNKTTICHRAGSHFNTLSVDPTAVATHLAHGDMLGACAGSNQLITRVPVETIADQLKIRALPNPTNNYFNLKWEGKDVSVSYKVTDISGRVIEQKQSVSSHNIIIGRQFKPGVYFVELRQGGEVVTLKLIKL